MPMLGGPQVDYCESLVVLNLGNKYINNLTITNHETAIATLTDENTALALASAELLAKNVTIGEIILNLIIPDPTQITYLGEVSAANDATITANDAIVAANDLTISGLTSDNSALAAENVVYDAENVLLAAIILEVTPN